MGVHTVDFYIPKLKMALEVDGPSHFLSPTFEKNGTTRAKHRMLQNIRNQDGEKVFDQFKYMTTSVIDDGPKMDQVIEEIINLSQN